MEEGVASSSPPCPDRASDVISSLNIFALNSFTVPQQELGHPRVPCIFSYDAVVQVLSSSAPTT